MWRIGAYVGKLSIGYTEEITAGCLEVEFTAGPVLCEGCDGADREKTYSSNTLEMVHIETFGFNNVFTDQYLYPHIKTIPTCCLAMFYQANALKSTHIRSCTVMPMSRVAMLYALSVDAVSRLEKRLMTQK